MNNKFLLILLSCICILNACNLLANNKKDTDLIVEADNSIEFFEKEKFYLASGNAIASKDGLTLNASEIKAFFKNKDNEIDYLIGKGKVSIRNKEIFGKAEKVIYDFKKKFITLSEGTQSLKTKDILIESKKILSFDNLKKIAKSKGKVKLILKNKTKVFSNQLSATFNKKTSKLEKATAKGKVMVITKSERSSCDVAFFDKKTNLITLKGNVIIEKNKSKIIGEKGITNLKTGTTKLLGDKKNKRIKGKFISNKR